MMRRVLDQLAADGTVDRRRLARRLEVSAELLDDMLGQLEAAGYVERFHLGPACASESCAGCPVAGGTVCQADGPRVWRLSAKGRRIAGSGQPNGPRQRHAARWV